MKSIFLIFLGTFALLSCKKEEKTNNVDTNAETESKEESYNQLKYTINLPDTVIVNKPYQAIIKFESSFDSIIDPVQINPHDPNKMRLITFYNYEPVKSSAKSNENLILIDSTFVLNKNFDVNNIIFKEKGEFDFCGLVLDEIRYKEFTKEGVITSIHYEERKQEIRKKVVVIDK